MNMALYLKTHRSQTLDPDGIPNLGGCSSKPPMKKIRYVSLSVY